MAGEGLIEEKQLQAAGFSEIDVGNWKAENAGLLFDAGFSEKQVNAHFGIKPLDMSEADKFVRDNVKAFEKKKIAENLPANTKADAKPEGDLPEIKPEGSFDADIVNPDGTIASEFPKVATTAAEAFEAGLQISIAGLLEAKPDILLPEDAPMFHRIMSQIGTLSGDSPAIAIGAIGAGPWGAFGLPAGLRKVLMDSYENNEISTFNEFWERLAGTMIETVKGGALGEITFGAGAKVKGILAPTKLPPIMKGLAIGTTEAATLTTVGAALDLRTPEFSEFIDAAVVIGGMHAGLAMAGKLANTYKRTGVRPADVKTEADINPVVKEDLTAKNLDMPRNFEILSDVPRITPELPKSLQPRTIPPQPTPSQAQSNILAKVGIRPPKTFVSLDTHKAYTAVVDKFHPINLVVKGKGGKGPANINTATDPYVLARLAADSKAKTIHFLKFGTVDFSLTKQTGPGLRKINEPILNDWEGYNAYRIARRAKEINKRGLTSGFENRDIDVVLKEGKSRFEATAKAETDFQNRVLDYGVEAGIFDAKTAEAVRAANESYIPFKRIFEAEAIQAKGKKGAKLKRFKGSERLIQDPTTSIVENTEAIIQASEINRARASLVDFVTKIPGQDIIERVRLPKQKIRVSNKELEAQFKKQGIKETGIEGFDIFRLAEKRLGPNEFEVMVKGKRQVWRTTDKGLAEALKLLDGDAPSTNLVFKTARAITRIMKAGITITPDFITKNLIRDQLTAGAFSKAKGIPVIDTIVAMKDIVGESQAYQTWLRSGGGNSAFIEMNTKYIERNIRQIDADTGFMGKVWNSVKHPLEFIEMNGVLVENATRLAEAKRVWGKDLKGLSQERLMQGGFASREVTVDFQRIGAKMSAVNAITAFQNVAIQGLDRTARAIKADPGGTIARSVGLITVPSVLLWWATHDDPRRLNTPSAIRDLFWIVPTDNWQSVKDPLEVDGIPDYLVRVHNGQLQINKGTVYRIPKPHELGIIFGSLPERILDAFFTDNPRAFKKFNESMIQLVVPSLIPDAIAPGFEQFANKTFFTGSPIIPEYLKQIAPEYQYTNYTSETAKALSKFVAVLPGISELGPREIPLSSPAVIDNYIQAWGGALGKTAVFVADQFLIQAGLTEIAERPTMVLADIPFVRSFVVRYPSLSAQSIADFRDGFREADRKFKTIEFLIKTFNTKGLERELGEIEENSEEFAKIPGINQALRNISKNIQQIINLPDMNKDEKRQLIDGLMYAAIQMAEAGNKAIDDFLKAAKNIKEPKQ